MLRADFIASREEYRIKTPIRGGRVPLEVDRDGTSPILDERHVDATEKQLFDFKEDI